MATSPPAPLSKCEIVEAHAKLEQLLVDMAARSAGGKRASGRCKKHDTASSDQCSCPRCGLEAHERRRLAAALLARRRRGWSAPGVYASTCSTYRVRGQAMNAARRWCAHCTHGGPFLRTAAAAAAEGAVAAASAAVLAAAIRRQQSWQQASRHGRRSGTAGGTADAGDGSAAGAVLVPTARSRVVRAARQRRQA